MLSDRQKAEFAIAVGDIYRRELDGKIPRSLLRDGVPREELHVMTPCGLVVWYPDGSVRAPRAKDGPSNNSADSLVSFISLVPR